jgi:hypothetical protein
MLTRAGKPAGRRDLLDVLERVAGLGEQRAHHHLAAGNGIYLYGQSLLREESLRLRDVKSALGPMLELAP